MNFRTNLLTLKAAVAVFALIAACPLAGADTIQDIVSGGNSVTYGNLTFSDFSISGDSNALGDVDVSNVDVAFVVSGDEVTLQFTPTGSPWSTTAFSTLGTFNISYTVTALGNYQIISASQTLDSGEAGAMGATNVDANIYDGDNASQKVGQMSVKDGFFGQDYAGLAAFNPSQDSLLVETNVAVATFNALSPASLDQFSQSYNIIDITPTPEPGTLGLLGLGGLAMIAHRRKARKARQG